MDISVILATYKRKDVLEKTLLSMARMATGGVEWELHVVDNAGDTATGDLVRSFQEKIPVHYWVETKAGKNNALNFGIAKAAGKIVVFTDDDVLVDPNWLSKIDEGLRRWPDDSVFGGKIVPQWPEGKTLRWNFPDAFYQPAFVVADWKIEEGQYDPGKVWGPAMIIRREIFDKGYRFNTTIGPKGRNNYIIGDEVEFTKRLAKDGYRSIYLPKVSVRHQIREEQLAPKWIYQRAFILGRTEAYEENLEVSNLLWGAPRYLYRLLIIASLKWLHSRLFSNDSNKKINSGVRYWHLYGKFCQSRDQLKFNRQIRG
jgi:glycosyltransferase involved in cell wall biosynthesis